MKVVHPPKEQAPYIGTLLPLTPVLKDYRIIGFDTEDDTKGTPISFAFYDGQDSFYTKSADEALDYIYNQDSPSGSAVCFVAHNLEYDIGNLFKFCDFKYVKEMIYASRLLHVSLYGSKNFFLNSSSFFQGPLKKMGDLVGLKKLDGNPFDSAYNKRDAEIPQVFMAGMQKRLHDLGVNLGVSVGQLAMSVYRRNFLRGRFRTFNHPDILKAYFGGRVEMFYKGVVFGPILVADINASYPDGMAHMPFPDTGNITPSRIGTHEFGVGKFKIRIPSNLFVPPLPFRSQGGRLFFPTGDIEGHFTYAEVRKAVEMGCEILGEEEGFGTEIAVFPFRDFVGHFWDLREAVKKDLQSASSRGEKPAPTLVFESLFLKLLMNNLYGKFAQHKPSVKMLRVRMSEHRLRKLKGVRENKIGPFYGYTIPRDGAPRSANYLWGVYITAYARLSLLEKILAVHESGATLLYCDTDSIMFKGEEGLKALKVGTGLGEMGVETYDLAVFRQAKGYLLCNGSKRVTTFASKGKVFHKGLAVGGSVARKDIGDLSATYTEYEVKKVACKGVPTHLALPFIRDGMAKAVKPLRLKEALIRVNAKANKGKSKTFFEKVGVNIWGDVQKEMKAIYIKRKGDKGVTYPPDASEIPGLEFSAYGAPTPMEELRGINFRQKRHIDPWRNIRIPKNWFLKERRRFRALERELLSKEIHFLKVEELCEVKPGRYWFKAKCLSRDKGEFGDYYHLQLTEFLGAKASKKQFLAALPVKYMEGVPEEKFIGKRLEILLNDSYTPGTSPDISARVG